MKVDNRCPGCHFTYPSGYLYNSGWTVRCPNTECPHFDQEMFQKYMRYVNDMDQAANNLSPSYPENEVTQDYSADDFKDLFRDLRDWR